MGSRPERAHCVQEGVALQTQLRLSEATVRAMDEAVARLAAYSELEASMGRVECQQASQRIHMELMLATRRSVAAASVQMTLCRCNSRALSGGRVSSGDAVPLQ